MQNIRTEIEDVIYNASSQSFEAKVTVYDQGQKIAYPCAIEAPITMPFKRAAQGLVTQALRRHGKPAALRSVVGSRLRLAVLNSMRRGLPEGEFGFFRGRAA